MDATEQVSVPIERRLVELMFTALPSIVLIWIGHGIAGVAVWFLCKEPLALHLTLVGLAIGCWRIALCLSFARRNLARETTESLKRWSQLYAIGGTSYSIALASLAMFCLHLRHEEATLLCLTVAMCYTVGMIIRVAVIPRAAQSQLLCLLLPIAVASALQWEFSYLVLSLLLAMFCVGGLQLIKHMHQTILSRFEAEQMLSRKAFNDHLTKLANRGMFEHMGEQVLAAGEPLVVAVLDLDSFKAINDTFGHDAGDFVLRTVAARMKKELPAPHLLARMGGDEFAILFKGAISLDSAAQIGERLLAVAAEDIVWNGHTLKVSASMGIAHSASRSASLALVFRRADAQLYKAKAHGKNQVRVQLDDEFPQVPFAA